MQSMFFHVNQPLGVASVVSHNDFGPTHTVRTQVVYPMEAPVITEDEPRVGLPAEYAVVCPKEHEFVWWQSSLIFSERDGNILVVEPDSANWILMNRHYYTIFETMKRPVPFGYVTHNPHISKEETHNFIMYCISRNLVRIENYPSIFEPLEMAPIPYIDRFVLQVGDIAAKERKRMPEKAADRVIERAFEQRFMDTIWIELAGLDIESDRELISHIMETINRQRERDFRKVRVLLHADCAAVTAEEAAYLDWNGIVVRGYCGSAEDLLEESTVERVRTMAKLDMLENLSVTITDPDDFFVLEDFLLKERLRNITLNFAPRDGKKKAYRDHHAKLMAEVCIKTLENMAGRLISESSRCPRIYPVSTVLRNLVSTRRDLPCAHNHPGGRSLFINSKGEVYHCGANRECPSEGAITASGCTLQSLMEKTSRCGAKSGACQDCQWRNFCPGLCPDAPWEDDRSDGRGMRCGFFRNIIPELMWKLEAKKDLLRFL